MKNKLLRTGEAAKELGIHPDTLISWEHKGVIKSTRHPFNNYRQYDPEDIQYLKEKLNKGEK